MNPILFIALLLLTTTLHAQDVVVADDGIPWQFEPLRNGTLAIGDVHGDPNALLQILIDRKVINPAGEWIAGPLDLVLVGDLLDRGPNSRAVLDICLYLEAEAATKGARVHALLGNHDVMVLDGDLRYVTKADHAQYEDSGIVKTLSSPDLPYAGFNARRNAIIKIGRVAFVHAGLEEWIETRAPAEVNATIRRYVSERMAANMNAAAPKPRYTWAIGERGPLWTRGIAENKTRPERVGRWLDILKVDTLSIGHTPTESMRVETLYGDSVVKVDTMISEGFGGKLSALAIPRGTSKFKDMQVSNNIPRRKRALPLLEKIRAKFTANASTCEGLRSGMPR